MNLQFLADTPQMTHFLLEEIRNLKWIDIGLKDLRDKEHINEERERIEHLKRLAMEFPQGSVLPKKREHFSKRGKSLTTI